MLEISTPNLAAGFRENVSSSKNTLNGSLPLESNAYYQHPACRGSVWGHPGEGCAGAEFGTGTLICVFSLSGLYTR